MLGKLEPIHELMQEFEAAATEVAATVADPEKEGPESEREWVWEKWIQDRWSLGRDHVFTRFRRKFAGDPEALAWVDDYQRWNNSTRLIEKVNKDARVSQMLIEDVEFANGLINYLADHMKTSEGHYDRQQYAKLTIDAMRARGKLRPEFPVMKLTGSASDSRQYLPGS